MAITPPTPTGLAPRLRPYREKIIRAALMPMKTRTLSARIRKIAIVDRAAPACANKLVLESAPRLRPALRYKRPTVYGCARAGAGRAPASHAQHQALPSSARIPDPHDRLTAGVVGLGNGRDGLACRQTALDVTHISLRDAPRATGLVPREGRARLRRQPPAQPRVPRVLG